MKPLLKVLGGAAIVCALIVMVSFTVTMARVMLKAGASATQEHIAVLELEGVILDSTDFIEELKKVEKNEYAKAVVVRINSPGGVVAPSQEYYKAIKELDQKKPVVVSMGSVAASGGYYAALGGRKIYANPGTLTASIGVIMELVNTEKLYQWAKIKRFTLKAGKLKDVGSPSRPMTPAERKFLNGLLANIHKQFKDAVRDNRSLEGEALATTTDGRIMTGEQAYKAKLVDALGGLTEAIKEARELAELSEEAPVIYPKPEKGALEKYLLGETFSGLFEKLKGHYSLELSPGWNVLLLAPLSH